MSKSANISPRLDPELNVEKLNASAGLCPSFNKETVEAFKEAQDIIDGKVESKAYSSVQDLVADIMEKD